MASAKDIKPLIKTAKKQGWTVTTTRNSKLKWVSPTGGAPYFSSHTPSDSRAIRNITSDLSRRGLAVNG